MSPRKSGIDPALTVRCPTCGAKIGEPCELGTGDVRKLPHRDRSIAAEEKASENKKTSAVRIRVDESRRDNETAIRLS